MHRALWVTVQTHPLGSNRSYRDDSKILLRIFWSVIPLVRELCCGCSGWFSRSLHRHILHCRLQVRAGSRGAGCPQGAAARPGMGIYGDLITEHSRQKCVGHCVCHQCHPGPSPEGTCEPGQPSHWCCSPPCASLLCFLLLSLQHFS